MPWKKWIVHISTVRFCGRLSVVGPYQEASRLKSDSLATGQLWPQKEPLLCVS